MTERRPPANPVITDLLLDALARGPGTREQAYKEVREGTSGFWAQVRAVRVIGRISIVESASLTDPETDIFEDIDAVASFRNSMFQPVLLQIKSKIEGDYGVRAYKDSRRYRQKIKEGERILVLAAGSGLSERRIVEQFFHELSRFEPSIHVMDREIVIGERTSLT